MTVKAEKLTPENAQESHIEIGDSAPVDLEGKHEARLFYFEAKVSSKNTRYFMAGAEILTGPGLGHTVFGPVYKGRSMELFLRALGHDPATIGPELRGDQVIGHRVEVAVEAEERETDGGGAEIRWTIKGFAPPPDDGQR